MATIREFKGSTSLSTLYLDSEHVGTSKGFVAILTSFYIGRGDLIKMRACVCVCVCVIAVVGSSSPVVRQQALFVIAMLAVVAMMQQQNKHGCSA